MSEELKRCPFCGGIEEVELLDINGCIYWVTCELCGEETKEYESAKEAIEAWNRRLREIW